MSEPADPNEIVVPPYEGPKPKKLFVGIRVSVPTANALAAAVETLARRAGEHKLDLRWVAPTNLHVTLRYLGWTRPEILPALRDRLDLALRGVEPFAFRCARLGAFPSIDRASILWAGVAQGEDRLVEVARRVEAAAVDLGFPAETRPFVAHVTLARLREPRPLKDVVLPLSEQMFSETRVEGITIIESETRSSGSVYSDLAKILFRAPENRPETPSERQMGALQMSAPHADTDDGWPRGSGPDVKD